MARIHPTVDELKALAKDNAITQAKALATFPNSISEKNVSADRSAIAYEFSVHSTVWIFDDNSWLRISADNSIETGIGKP